MDLQKISSGMDNGPEAIEHNFEAVDQTVENMGGQLSGLHWSELSQDGMVIDGDWGLLPVNRNSGYQTAKLGDKTIVWLHPIIQRLNSDFTGSHTGYILHLPKTIEPATYRIGGDIDADTEWNYLVNSGIALNGYSENTGTLWKEGNLFGFSKLYLAN